MVVTGKTSRDGLDARVANCGLALCVLLFAALAAPVRAQEAHAGVSGRVTDERGQVIPNLLVVAQAREVPLTFNARTASNGEYSFPSLPAGTYVVTFAHTGRVPVKRTVHLSPAERVVAHAVMRPDQDFDGATTVIDERLVYPRGRATLFDPRTADKLLPITGTMRSVMAMSSDLAATAPSTALFLFDGLPLRYGWLAGSGDAFAGPTVPAIRELTLVPASLPATYGRQEAGLLAVATPSGTDRLAGSAQLNFGNAGFRADLLRNSRQVDGLARSFAFTVGGPVRRGSTWFFATGQHLAESTPYDTALTGIPFESDTTDRFGLVKVLHRINEAHRVEAQWLGARQRISDAPPPGALVADLGALERRTLSDRALSFVYTGVLDGSWLLTTRYTRENGSTEPRDSLIDPEATIARTSLIDLQSGIVSSAPWSCVACEPGRSANNTLRAEVSTLLPKRHHFTAGIDLTRDTLTPATHPPGGSFQLFPTRLDAAGDTVLPVFAPGTSWIAWSPDADNSMRVRSSAVFVSDRWSVADQLTVDAGLRFDRFRGTARANGAALLAEQGFSPRVAVMWRPSLDFPWAINAAYGRYLAGVTERSVETTFATRPSRRVFLYDGPAINVVGAPSDASAAAQSVLDWFSSAGGMSRTPWFVHELGVTTTAPSVIAAPSVDEWTVGMSRTLGEDGWFRADVTSHKYGRFSTRRVLPDGQGAVDRFGFPVDAGTVEPDDRLEQRYVGFSLGADYRFGHWADVGARYTVSSLRGNVDQASLSDAWPVSGALAYPEFTAADWHHPIGDLTGDARHRIRAWIHSEVIADERRGTLMMSVFISAESGRPYGAAGLVAVAPYVTNPGYQQPPAVARYRFTDRDAFRTSRLMRLDAGVGYRRRLPGTVLGELVARLDLLNLGGATAVLQVQPLAVAETALTNPALQPFNPFTERPAEGVHWRLDTRTVQPPTTMGRAVRLSFGIRF